MKVTYNAGYTSPLDFCDQITSKTRIHVSTEQMHAREKKALEIPTWTEQQSAQAINHDPSSILRPSRVKQSEVFQVATTAWGIAWGIAWRNSELRDHEPRWK